MQLTDDQASGANGATVGKRAATREVLESEARAYVRGRMYRRGGLLREGIPGFWHKTMPFLIGLESRPSIGGVLALSFRVVTVVAVAFLPILGRRAITSGPSSSDDIDGFLGVLQSLKPIDYWLGLVAIIFIGTPKLLDAWARRRAPATHAPYGTLAAAIEQMPPLVEGTTNGSVQAALSGVLTSLKSEMEDLIADSQRKHVTDVTLLQYCDQAGTRMEVRARTAVGEPIGRPVSAALFLANYVGREGRWFAENDFLRKANPFKPRRLTVVGNVRVTYRSVLYLPILTAVKTHDVHGSPIVVDCCIGVICVQSSKPYRFWRWGDHTKDSGGGFGNIAIERALPYIALVTKLVESTAHKVPLEAAYDGP